MLTLKLKGLEKHLMVKDYKGFVGQCNLEQMMARSINCYLSNNFQTRKVKEPQRIILRCKTMNDASVK